MSEDSLDSRDQRYYTTTAGRFYTPDPAGAAAVDLGNPTSWNMYAYANDDPINGYDPTGRWACNPDDPDCDPGCDPLDPTCDPRQEPVPVPPPPPPIGGKPTCEDFLDAGLSGFLSGKGSPLADYVDQMIQVGQADDIDPTLLAAMAIAENGQAMNNPFSLGPNGRNTYPSLTAAINAVGTVLQKYIYTRNESSVSALWSGNTWKTVPRRPWVTIQYPGYCVGTTAAGVAGCQNTGKTIAGFMQQIRLDDTVGGNPNKLQYPCPE
jgi:RHS repeat-associated protein